MARVKPLMLQVKQPMLWAEEFPRTGIPSFRALVEWI